MTAAASIPPTEAHSPDLPKPILFHPLKHHLQYIREFARQSTQLPEQELKKVFRRIGGSQMDLYLGALSPLQVSEEVILYLQQQGLLQPEVFKHYLGLGGYRLCTLSDGSVWALRWGVYEGRYVHLHPGRYSNHTIRVKANHLKTALAVAIASTTYKQPLSLELMNQVRTQWLDLSPVPGFTSEEGLGKIIELILDLSS
ncbi:hypothetical protein [Pontibacter ruber]|uniref:Uncharacterized protein n=1 Tax=Pontibacter ruber TaxID=1343895 RepID=A0ABW5D2E1_9BACT|nr:hypothetical protein [Pontibacter ruber]